jgi:hypothetical protein
MSFRLTNAPAHFMYLMVSIFMAESNKFIMVFFDDILIYSKNAKEHEGHLRIVLQQLRDHQFYAKFSKCEFWLAEVLFLENMISKEGIFVDPSKVRDILDWKPPKSMHQVHNFLGLPSDY